MSVILKSRLARTSAAAVASLSVAVTSLVLATSSPAQAEARCTNGRPHAAAGKFRNNTDQTIMVKGDKHLGNNRYKTVEVAIGRNGGTALAAGVCDVDFIKTYWDWYHINTVVDGDSWKKILGSWSCWNAPGSGYRIACGAG